MVRNKTNGFTLIELLVVISIISLLIAMLLPSVEKARASGEQIVCATNLRQMGMAMESYVNEWDDWMPYYEAWYGDHYRSKLKVDASGNWFWGKGLVELGELMNSYLDSAGDANADILNTEQGLWCASHNGQMIDNRYGGAPIPTTSHSSVHGHLASYGYNHLFLGSQWGAGSNAASWFYRKKSFVNFPSNIITHADNGYSFPSNNTGYKYGTKISRTAPIFSPTDPDDVIAGRAQNMIPEYRDELVYPLGDRHLKGSNAVCLDGHAEWQLQKDWHAGDFDHRWTELNTDRIKYLKD